MKSFHRRFLIHCRRWYFPTYLKILIVILDARNTMAKVSCSISVPIIFFLENQRFSYHYPELKKVIFELVITKRQNVNFVTIFHKLLFFDWVLKVHRSITLTSQNRFKQTPNLISFFNHVKRQFRFLYKSPTFYHILLSGVHIRH